MVIVRSSSNQNVCYPPGIIYVRLRKALSICETCPAFFVMNSSYMDNHCGGNERILPSDDDDDDCDALLVGLEKAGGAGIAPEYYLSRGVGRVHMESALTGRLRSTGFGRMALTVMMMMMMMDCLWWLASLPRAAPSTEARHFPSALGRLVLLQPHYDSRLSLRYPRAPKYSSHLEPCPRKQHDLGMKLKRLFKDYSNLKIAVICLLIVSFKCI